MYSKIGLDDVDPVDVDGMDAEVLPVGYHLRPEKMRPSVWRYEDGESGRRHRQGEQEELYVVLDGSYEMTVERDGDVETFDFGEGDYVVVPPETWRQLTAREDSTLLVVGAPNVKDDGIWDRDG